MMRRWFFGLSAGGLASKLLGLLREALLARSFGTGPVADAYRASLTAVLSPVHLLINRLVQHSFIPLYAAYSEERREREAHALFALLLAAFVALGLLLGGLLYLAAHPLAGLLFPGFDPERRRLTGDMLRIVALGAPFYVYSSLLSSLGSAQRDFLIPSLRPGLQNLGMLVMILVAVALGRPVLAAWGFTLSYLALAGLGTWLLFRRGEIPRGPRPPRALVGQVGGRLWLLWRPLILVSCLGELQILAERYLASLTGGGAVAAMDYARFLTELGHFLIIVPIGLIGLGHYSRLSAAETEAKAARHGALLLLLLVPASAFLAIAGEGLLRLLYLRGRFDADSLALTQAALRGLALGLWAYSGSYFLQSVYSARLRSGVVLRGELLFTTITLAGMLLLAPRLGVFGLALGSSCGALVSLSFYLSRWPALARRLLAPLRALLVALPIYLLLAWGLGRLAGGLPGLALQLLVLAGFWALAYRVAGEPWRLLREALRGARAPGGEEGA